MRYTKERKKTAAAVTAVFFLALCGIFGFSGSFAGESLLEYEPGSEESYVQIAEVPAPEEDAQKDEVPASEREPETVELPVSEKETETIETPVSEKESQTVEMPASEQEPESEKSPDTEQEQAAAQALAEETESEAPEIPEQAETQTETQADDTELQRPLWDENRSVDPGKGDLILRETQEGILVLYNGGEYLADSSMKIRISGQGSHNIFVSAGKDVHLVLEAPVKAGLLRVEGKGECHLELKDPEHLAPEQTADEGTPLFVIDKISLAGDILTRIEPEREGLSVHTGMIERSANSSIISPEGSLVVDTQSDETEMISETEELTPQTEKVIETEEVSETEADPETELFLTESGTEIQAFSVPPKMMLLKATPGTNEYGTDPFDLEYSSGAIVSVGADSIHCSGMSGPVTLTNAGAGTTTTIYIADNTQKSANVYKDFYGGAVMGQERFDVRIYSWGKDDAGQGYAVMPMGYGALGASANTYSNGAVYTHSPTKIWLEYHFYKEGTLKTSSPQEVSFKGTIRYDDIDLNEGYSFIQGYNGAWTDQDSTIKRTSDSQTGLTWYLGTKNTEVGMSSVTQTIWVQVNSSKSVPYTCVYDAQTSFSSSASASTVNITYKLTPKSAVPSSFKMPPGEAYHAKYGSYKVEPVQKIAGYTFRGWNTSQDMTGTKYENAQTIVTSSNLTLWGEYTLDTADITVSKSVVIPEGSLYSSGTARPLKGEGIALELTGKGTAGISTKLYAVTGKDGKAVFKDVPLSAEKSYTVKEVEESVVRRAASDGNASAVALAGTKITPLSWFTAPAGVTTSLGASGASLKIENRMRRWKLKVWKTDSVIREKKRAQQEASLEGAVYALYDSGKQIAVYKTDADGYFETGEFLPGDSWTLREIKAPEGYLIDPSGYKIRAGAGELEGSSEVVQAKLDTAVSGSAELVTDPVMRGRFVLKKTYGMSPETAKPLAGAGFGIYAVSDLNRALGLEGGNAKATAEYIAGHLLDESGAFYEKIRSIPTACVYADQSDKDVKSGKLVYSFTFDDGTRINAPQGGYICAELKTGADGTLTSPMLPYGKYIIVETTTPPGALCAEPAVVMITQDADDKETAGDGKGSGALTVMVNDRPVMAAVEIIKTDALTGKDVTVPGAQFVIHDTDHAWADQVLSALSKEEQESYLEKYGDLIVDENGRGSYEQPFVTQLQENSGAAGAEAVSLPPGRYSLEEVKAPEGFICHGYEGGQRTDENGGTFWEAVNMLDSKWSGSIRPVDESRTGIWKPRYGEESRPVLTAIEIGSENTVYDREAACFRSQIRLENERFYGKISVFVQKERLLEYRQDDGEQTGTFVYETVPAQGCSFEVRPLEDIAAEGVAGAGKILLRAGQAAAVLTTDENGEAWTGTVKAADETILPGLPGGKYELVMTGPDSLLRLEKEPSRVFEVKYADDKTPFVYEDALYRNKPLRSSLLAQKTDAASGKNAGGAVIGLYTAAELKDDEGTVKVKADTLVGKVISKQEAVSFSTAFILDEKKTAGDPLPEGEYYVKELSAPAGYYLNAERIPAKEPKKDDQVITVKDIPIEGRFFLKDDLTFNELADAHFVVYDPDGNVADTFVTRNTSGKGYLLKGLRPGLTYTIEEKLPREGYTNLIRDRDGKETGSENRMQFTVPADPRPFTVTAYNAFITGNIRLVKTGDKLRSVSDGDSDLVSTLFRYEKENLAGAEFTVYAAEDIQHPDGITGTVIHKDKEALVNVREKPGKAVGVTDRNGEITFKRLYPGHYKVVETAAPEGFVRIKEPLDLYIDASGIKDQETEASAEEKVLNPRQQVEVRVIKKDSENAKQLRGAVFGLYANADIRSSQGTVLLKKGDLIEQAVTGSDGMASFRASLPLGRYLVRELSPPSGYQMSDETFSFEAVWKDGRDKLSFSHTFLDEPIRVELRKTDKTGGKELPGAGLALLTQDGKVAEEWASQEKPHVIRCLEAGRTYTLRETSPPPGWASSEDVSFTVQEPASDEAVIQTVIMEDEPIIIDIIARENDPSGNGKTVEGVHYHLVDEKGNMVVIDGNKMVFISKEGASVIEKIPAGNYKVITDSVPDGYLKPDPVRITVKDTADLQHFKILLEKAPKVWDGYGESAVKTGDESPLGRLLLLMGMSVLLAGVCLAWIMRKES